MKKLILSVMAGVALCACNAQSGYKITGNVEGIPSSKTYLLSFNANQIDTLGSSAIKDGKFEFSGNVDGIKYAMIAFEGQRGGMPIFLENGNFTVNISATDPFANKVEGGAAQGLYNQFSELSMEIMKQQQPLQQAYMAANQAQDQAKMDSIENVFNQLITDMQAKELDLIKANPDAYVTAFMIAQSMQQLELEAVKERFALLSEAAQMNEWGKQISEFIAQQEKTAVGATAPDFTDLPVVVLTSSHSASGAEMFAAAVRSHRLGISIGQRTYGKGVAQLVLDEDFSVSSVAELFDGDCLKITAYRFYAPDGATNDTVGVLPTLLDTVGVIPTLLVSPEHTQSIALLLRSSAPTVANGSLRLGLGGYTFYIDLSDARNVDNRAAFTELLEALPPSAELYEGQGGGTWEPIEPEALAEELGLEYHSRTFSDTADSPFADAIDTLAVYGLVEGYEDGAFRPEETITRGEFASMVASALNLRAPSKSYFSDVSEDAWYADGVNAMAAKGFFAGDGSTFRPEDTITYEEMVTVLSSVAAWASLDGYELAQKNLSAGEWGNYCWGPWWGISSPATPAPGRPPRACCAPSWRPPT